MVARTLVEYGSVGGVPYHLLAVWVRYKPSGAARLAADAVRDRTKLAGMYTRFLKSFQDSRRIGELRYRLHSITSVGFCTLVPNLRSSRALVDYEDLLRAMKQALQVRASKARQSRATCLPAATRTRTPQPSTLNPAHAPSGQGAGDGGGFRRLLA